MPPNKAQNRAPQLGGKTRHQFVTKTRSFRGIFAMVRTGKAKQAKRFSFLTTQLTRWRSAVRARTGLPFPSFPGFTFFSISPLAGSSCDSRVTTQANGKGNTRLLIY